MNLIYFPDEPYIVFEGYLVNKKTGPAEDSAGPVWVVQFSVG